MTQMQSTTEETRPFSESWRDTLPYLIHYVLFGISWTLYFAFAAMWLVSIDIPATLIGTMFLGGAFARFALTPLTSEISDRFGQRWYVLLGLYSILIPLGLMMTQTTLPVWAIFVLVVLYVACLGVTLSTLESYVLLSSKELKFNYTTVRGALSLSVAIVCIIAGWAFKVYGVKDLLPMLVFISFVLLWISLWALPRIKSERSTDKSSLLKPLQIEGVGVAIILGMLTYMSFAPFMGLGNLYFVESRGFSEYDFGLIMGVGVFAEAVFFFWVGKRAQKWRVFWLLAMCAGLTCIRVLGYKYGDSLMAMMLFHAMHAFSFGIMHTMLMEMFRRHMPKKYLSSATGLYDMMGNVGYGTGAAVAGYIHDNYGADGMIDFSVAVTIVAMVISVTMAIKRQ